MGVLGEDLVGSHRVSGTCWEGVKVGVKNTDLSELGLILSNSLSVKDLRAVTVAEASVCP